jgi:hypothetical protein
MLPLYEYDDKNLTIHKPFRELWSIMKCKGEYILPPTPVESLIKMIPDQITVNGTIMPNKQFYFSDNLHEECPYLKILGNELHFSVEYDYEIQWAINNNVNELGFYSPYRKFSSDRLYLNYDKNKQKLTKYKCKSGKILISCNILVIAISDINGMIGKNSKNNNITLKICPIAKHQNIGNVEHFGYCKIQVFDIKREGIFYRPIVKPEFKKLYCLVRKYYEITSIKRKYNLKLNIKHNLMINKMVKHSILPNTSDRYNEVHSIIPKEIDYTNILSKSSYESIFTVTTKAQPSSDRMGYYGIVIKREPGVISSATVYYEFKLSTNILQTPDVFVMAAYYEGDKGYVLHQIYDKKEGKDIYVMNVHEGPYPNDKNYISGNLDLESTATDITLIIGNSLYGILPTNGQNPDTIIEFKKFDIKYTNIDR